MVSAVVVGAGLWELVYFAVSRLRIVDGIVIGSNLWLIERLRARAGGRWSWSSCGLLEASCANPCSRKR